MVKARYLQSNS